MKYIIKKIKISFLLAVSAITIFSSCNKDLEKFAETLPVAATGSALGDTLKSSANDSLYYRLIIKSGLLSTLNNKSTSYTMFVPDNNGMKLFINALSGGLVPLNAPDAVFSGFITANIPAASAAGLVSYNTCPQALAYASIPGTFPNFQYPTIINPAPTLSALARLTTFPTSRNGGWLNNVPIIAPIDKKAANGVIHHIATIAAPPQRAMWERINTDADLTIFKTAIQRADSGIAPTGSASLIWALTNFGPNLTVFAPTNAAMKNAISFLTGGLLPVGAPDANFIGFLQSNSISTLQVKGIVVYHILGSTAFLNNLPTTTALFPTLLNGGVPNHPGVGLTCTISGFGVSAATVKGLINPTASNVLINPTPDALASYGATPPAAFTYTGKSDQFYINGTLHKIDQVLLPQ